MLHRAATLALSLALAIPLAVPLAGCKGKPGGAGSGSGSAPGSAVPVAPAPVIDAAEAAGEPAPGARNQGSKWTEGEPGDDEGRQGGMQMFKEAWVYVDGRPLGVLYEPELPDGIPIAWHKEETDVEFDANSTGPRSMWVLLKRWRLADYLRAAGVDVKKVKMVVVHGGRGVVAIPGDVFRKYQDGIRFDLTGITRSKLRVFFPNDMPRDTSFDRYFAVSVIVDKPVPEVDRKENSLLLDGEEIGGIPYHGTPLRGGVRIYLDGKLAMVLKRNQLGDTAKVDGPTPRWNLGGLLTASGVTTTDVVAADVVVGEWRERVDGFDLAKFNVQADEGASGKILEAGTGRVVQAMHLFTKGKVPKVWVPEPFEKQLDGKIVEPYPAKP